MKMFNFKKEFHPFKTIIKDEHLKKNFMIIKRVIIIYPTNPMIYTQNNVKTKTNNQINLLMKKIKLIKNLLIIEQKDSKIIIKSNGLLFKY